jgi:predicted enzyme related to lactoylglutathione lyase
MTTAIERRTAMTHRSRLAGFIIDCNTDDLDAATDFWSQALGCGIADRDAGDDTAQYQMLGDTPGDLHIEVQKVDHASRVHLDIEADDIDAEVARLEALGAKRIAFVKRWWVMEAPTGQRFCIVRMKHPELGAAPNAWE